MVSSSGGDRRQSEGVRTNTVKIGMRLVGSSLACLMLVSQFVYGQRPRPRFEELVHEFDYDHRSPLDVREEGRRSQDGVTIIELSYASPRGGRVPASLVLPPAGRGPFAALLFGHWMMPGSPFRNRREFLDEAVVLARSGVVSLLTDATLIRPGFIEEKDEMRAQAQSAEASRQQVIDFRRGVDLLLARGDVDPERIAYVGHSYNAHIGAILSGVEKRIHSFVLMAGNFADEEYVFDPENAEMRKIRERIGDETLRAFFQRYAFDDPAHFIGHSAPAAIFLQFGRKDKPLPEKWARRCYQMFGRPKKIGFYDAGHALNGQARLERLLWLAERLRLPPIDRRRLAAIEELK